MPDEELFEELLPEPEQFPNNSETIPEMPAASASGDDSEKLTKIGRVGRQRRYEEAGIKDIPPVKDVVLFRYAMGRHYPGLSRDMQDWYEHYYFTRPIRAERARDAKEYERHVKSWERGRRWIAEEYGVEALADSRKIIALRRRAGSER